MKTIGRIFVILFAALAVTGATWAVGQSSSNSAFVPRERGGFERPEGEFRERGELGGRGDHHSAQFLSLRGWLGFGQTLIPMTIIIAVIALPMRFWKQRKRARRSEEAAALPV